MRNLLLSVMLALSLALVFAIGGTGTPVSGDTESVTVLVNSNGPPDLVATIATDSFGHAESAFSLPNVLKLDGTRDLPDSPLGFDSPANIYQFTMRHLGAAPPANLEKEFPFLYGNHKGQLTGGDGAFTHRTKPDHRPFIS